METTQKLSHIFKKTFSTMVPGLNVDRKNKLIGILIANPSIDFTKKEILPNLSHYNNKSDVHIDFFCIGYSEFYGEGEVVAKNIDGKDWIFDENIFYNIIDELQGKSTWKYNYTVQLLLLNVSAEVDELIPTYSFNFNKSLVLDLETISTNKVYKNISNFLVNSIFENAKEIKDVGNMSNKLYDEKQDNFISNLILKLLSKKYEESFDYFNEKQMFTIKNISKK